MTEFSHLLPCVQNVSSNSDRSKKPNCSKVSPRIFLMDLFFIPC